jgi:hypothetical protein
VFLLSPANVAGERAKLLMNERAGLDLAIRLRGPGAGLGEVMSFLSGLYFRGKLAYARAYGRPSRGLEGALVITAGDGLRSAEQTIVLSDLRRWARVPIDGKVAAYREPLVRDARRVAKSLGTSGDAVLLGSIATGKYLDPLGEALGERLLIPAEFAGRGDMSRGGLMLRCVAAGKELTCVPVARAARHAPRPPRLSRLD